VLEGLSLLDDPVNSLAKVSRLKVRAGFRALKLLPSFVVGVDAFIIIKIDIFFLGRLLLDLVLILLVIGELVDVKVVFVRFVELLAEVGEV